MLSNKSFALLALCVAFAGVAFAGPLGQRDETPAPAAAGTPEPDTTAVAVVDTLNTGDESEPQEVATVDETGVSAAGNETHIRQKRSCGCGCCCCRPCCCCCCRPCCCCCRCCCCRCCCCCCRPCCCCCCRPCCCCCCRPCCGCCGCGGGRKRRSIQALTHKLMDKQAALLRASAEVTTTEAAPVLLSNAQIDSFGRSFSNLAFADFAQQQQQQQEQEQQAQHEEQLFGAVYSNLQQQEALF